MGLLMSLSVVKIETSLFFVLCSIRLWDSRDGKTNKGYLMILGISHGQTVCFLFEENFRSILTK